MKELFSAEETVAFCKTLSSKLRMDMVQYINRNPGASLNELSQAFGVSRAAVTQNVQILIEAKILETRQVPGKRGGGKSCYLLEHDFRVSFDRHFDSGEMYVTDIPIGQYCDYSIIPHCGIVTPEKVIGAVNDPRFFDAPERNDAGLLWIGGGYIEYRLPNYLQESQVPVEIRLTVEISSKAPDYADQWPSDVTFHFNATRLCTITTPGEFHDKQGLYTPDWWNTTMAQYGLQRQIRINRKGTFINGVLAEPLKIQELNLNDKSEFRFRISVPETGHNAGGLSLFGKGFGNYEHAIKFRLIYNQE